MDSTRHKLETAMLKTSQDIITKALGGERPPIGQLAFAIRTYGVLKKVVQPDINPNHKHTRILKILEKNLTLWAEWAVKNYFSENTLPVGYLNAAIRIYLLTASQSDNLLTPYEEFKIYAD